MFGLGSVSVKKKDSKSKELVDESYRLRPDAFSAAGKALLTASGVPGTADALSFEPVQGLVAVGRCLQLHAIGDGPLTPPQILDVTDFHQ